MIFMQNKQSVIPIQPLIHTTAKVAPILTKVQSNPITKATQQKTTARQARQVASKNQYNAPTPPANNYGASSLPTYESNQVVATPYAKRPSKPIAITRYVYNSPTGEETYGDSVFNYAYESANGIKQR